MNTDEGKRGIDHFTDVSKMVQCGRRKSNMEKKMIMNYKKRFDEIRHEENRVEFWYARELRHLLDYLKWKNFENVLSSE